MQNQGIGTWISRQRVKSRGRPALIHEDRELSYEEFADRIDRFATALAQRGITKGDRVAFLGNNHPAFLETLFAAAQLGAIFVPLNTRLAPPELEYALEDSGAEVLVFTDELRESARKASWSTRVRARIRVDGDAYPAVEAYDELIAENEPFAGDVSVTLDDPAVILYTSGTTGHPKGALLTHGNLTWNSVNVLVDHDVTSSSTTLLIAPMFHVASLGMGALPTLLKGARVLLHDRFEPGAVLRDIERYQVTGLSGVPTTFQMLSEHEAWPATDTSSLRMLTCGGSSVPARVMDAFEARGLGFTNGYGMTETAPGATTLPSRDAREKPGSSGLPHFFTDVRIADEAGNDVPQGEIGEILIQGPNVIHEYWRRPEATAESRHGDWFRSGDLGYLDEEGYLFVSDRSKDMIISGGENIYPAEIEQVIMELREIDSVAMIGIPDDRWGEVPLAVVVTKSGEPLPEGLIEQHLTGRVAKYKIPRKVAYASELPRTASGKVRKPDLRREYAEGKFNL